VKFFEPSGNRWRVLFMDRQGQVLGASPLLPGLVEAQLVAEQGVKGSGDVALVQVVQVRREGRVGLRTSSQLILP
jgi:hypothetical protein